MSETQKTSNSKTSLSEGLKKIPAVAFWIFLVAIVLLAGIISISSNAEKTDAARAKEITKQLRCLECEGLSIYDSDTKTSNSISKDVSRRLKSGDSEAEIFSYYESVYGEFIRLAPTSDKGNWLIYVVPSFFVIVFLGAIFLSIKNNVSGKTIIAFWVIAGVLFVAGLGIFISDSKAETKSASESNTKSTEELLQQAVDESPNNGNYRSLAIVQFASEDYVKALQNFDKAVELNEKDAESQGYASYIVFLSGEYELAKTRAQKAVESNSQDVTALFFRGLISLQTPESDAAKKSANEKIANTDFDQVLKLAPDSNFAEQIRTIRS